MKKKEEQNGAEISGVPVADVPLELGGSRKRIRDRYPDVDPADEAALEEAYSRYMDDSESVIGRYQEVEGRMSELCRMYPEFAELIYNMLENKLPFRAAVAKVFSQEDLIPEEGDEDYEAYRKAYGERQEGLKKRESQTKGIEDNEAKSLETINVFCESKGLDDARKDELVGLINDHFTELLYKRISPAMLEGFLKQMSFDGAVAEAEKAGELRGRNGKIDAKRQQEKAAIYGDGLPGTAGGAVRPAENAPKRNFFELPERKTI